MSKKLTPKQKKFADSYIESGNATQSAIKAGYSRKTAKSVGSENLTKPDIKSYIEKKMKEVESHKIMDAKEAMELLTRIARGEEMETKVVATRFDVETVEVPSDNKTKMIAVKELLKRYPDNDRLLEAQIKRAEAEARIAEAQADSITDGVNDNVTFNFIRTDRRDKHGND
ncbi:terminase small subunit [Pediococcus pentosaceus]|uniref:terminase small subunit n=1 Tax=Pediococcus pentosaceus TaxID=1255 RepID=UPI003D77385B